MLIKNNSKGENGIETLENKSVKLFGDPPSVSACGAFEPFHSFPHAIRPREMLTLAIAPGGVCKSKGRTYISQFWASRAGFGSGLEMAILIWRRTAGML